MADGPEAGPPFGAERLDLWLERGWSRARSHAAGPARRAGAALHEGVRRTGLLAALRWVGSFRLGRRILPTLPGWIYLGGVIAIGLAAINTGNNLLYLLLGALLGTVAVSGWLSERVLRGLEVRRVLPRGVVAGPAVRTRYEVRNEKPRLASFDVRLRERGLPGPGAWLLRVDPGARTGVRSEGAELGRGVYPLEVLTLSTTFPFGLVRKERDVRIPGELVVRPRSDRRVEVPALASRTGRLRGEARGRSALGHRGEYRGLREYRPGDDLRDVHWRKSASAPTTVVREYEPEAGREVRIHLDVSAEPGARAEAAAEIAASLAARAVAEGRPFALRTSDGAAAGGSGTGALDDALDLLARVRFGSRSGADLPPDPESWILVDAGGKGALGFGAALEAGGPGGRT